MDPASPSLEGIICFSSEPALEAGERSRAKQKFYRISMAIPIDGADDHVDFDKDGTDEHLGLAVSRFADHFFDNSFLPHRHRCVISRRFNSKEATKQNNGNPLGADPRFSHLEVTHIFPHSPTTSFSQKKATLDILKKFNNRVIHLIKEGNDIDRPRNAIITLTRDPHISFKQHTYQIRSFLPPLVMLGLPVVRAFYLTENRNMEPPSLRLILEDMEWKVTRADGSTGLGHLVTLRLGGWLQPL
ncbi:hypothetical protein B0H63DRAFT_503702 [Podospora didyma]|uniref:HNH nuclease domain-containing protein n=1 Tax=Podospora didyma TaxID=330526 RepID=A0AAE0N766_9PEZI|nr:hypothetical protein B0H63DRAFT_503702 [Podospora didyma]